MIFWYVFPYLKKNVDLVALGLIASCGSFMWCADSRVVVCQLSSCGMWALSLYASHLLGSVFKGWKLCSEHEGQGSCPHAAYILVEEMGTKQVKK